MPRNGLPPHGIPVDRLLVRALVFDDPCAGCDGQDIQGAGCVGEYHAGAVQCDPYVVSTVADLGVARRPSAVSGFIISVIVDAVESETRRAFSHVGKECIEAIPLWAECDAATSVVLPLGGLGVGASGFHRFPGAPCSGASFPMRSAASSVEFCGIASARDYFPLPRRYRDVTFSGIKFDAAIAAKPQAIDGLCPVWSGNCITISNDDNPTVSSPDEDIFSVCHSGNVPRIAA